MTSKELTNLGLAHHPRRANPQTIGLSTHAVPATTSATGGTLYQTGTESPRSRFLVNEVLRGAPVTVVGATYQVAEQIPLDPTARQRRR